MNEATQKPPDQTTPGIDRPDSQSLAADWSELFTSPAIAALTKSLQRWVPSRRWFRSKARVIESITIRERISVPLERESAYLLLFQVNYTQGDPELYVLPLACAFDEEAGAIARETPQSILTKITLNRPPREGVVYDAIVSKKFCRALLALLGRR